MPLTDTTDRQSFTIERPGNNKVTFEFASQAARISGRSVVIRLPTGSTWRPDPHWHERYTEYVRVLQGRVKIVLNGAISIMTPKDGVRAIPRFAVHEWMRGDIDAPDDRKDREEVVVEEFTSPGTVGFSKNTCQVY